MCNLGVAVHLQATADVHLCPDRIPYRDVNHHRLGLGVSFLGCFKLVEVFDKGADLQTHHLGMLDRFNQPFVDVQLGFPVNLVHHHRIGFDKLVVNDDHTVCGVLLQIDRPADCDSVHLCKQPLFVDVPLNLFGFQLAMHECSKLRCQQRSDINFDLVIILFAQPSDFRW